MGLVACLGLPSGLGFPPVRSGSPLLRREEIKLVFSIPPHRPTSTMHGGRLGTPDDLCRASDTKDLDKTGYLVE